MITLRYKLPGQILSLAIDLLFEPVSEIEAEPLTDSDAETDIILTTPCYLFDEELQDVEQKRLIVYGYPDTPLSFMQAFWGSASGYIPEVTPQDEFVQIVETIAKGETWYPEKYNDIQKEPLVDLLTPRLIEYCTHVIQDNTVEEIADSMCVCPATVHQYKQRVKKRLGINNECVLYVYLREQLVAKNVNGDAIAPPAQTTLSVT